MKLEPGRDYGVLTISFDKDDTPAIAKEKKVTKEAISKAPFKLHIAHSAP